MILSTNTWGEVQPHRGGFRTKKMTFPVFLSGFGPCFRFGLVQTFKIEMFLKVLCQNGSYTNSTAQKNYSDQALTSRERSERCERNRSEERRVVNQTKPKTGTKTT